MWLILLVEDEKIIIEKKASTRFFLTLNSEFNLHISCKVYKHILRESKEVGSKHLTEVPHKLFITESPNFILIRVYSTLQQCILIY